MLPLLLENHVASLLPKKVTQLLRSLDKSYEKNLQQQVDQILKEMKAWNFSGEENVLFEDDVPSRELTYPTLWKRKNIFKKITFAGYRGYVSFRECKPVFLLNLKYDSSQTATLGKIWFVVFVSGSELVKLTKLPLFISMM